VDELVMVTPEVVVVMSMTITLAAARGQTLLDS
jgi:hypothetical protein